MSSDLAHFVMLPVGLGLLGFVEPCSMGSSLVFVKYLEGKGQLAKLSQVTVFTLSRGVFIGLLGASAALLGAAFLGFQKAAWIGLGAIYVAIGAFYLLGKAGFLMRTIGPPRHGFRRPAARPRSGSCSASTSRPA